MAKTKIEIFFSYAHADETWHNKLETHLSSLKRQKRIITWYDRNIPPGAEWASEIDAHLKTADIILLLISPDFISSDYCWSVELKEAIKRHNAGEACVIPIIVRPAVWSKTPFAKLQALPTDGKPVSTSPDIDEALVKVAKGIEKAVDAQREKSTARTSRATPQAASLLNKEPTSVQMWNVPFPRNPFFTGREDVLEHIHTLLSTKNAAFISQPPAISGLGGIGKTQTAAEYAYRYQQEYQYVQWLQANTRETLISDVVTLAGLLALPEKDAEDQRRTIEAVKRWFEEHSRWLLIVDNADDLPMVDTFLPRKGSGHILLTTRSHSMSGRAQRMDIETMEVDEGVLFLLRRAALIPPDRAPASIADDVRAQATAIINALGGLPLALDQAGAYIEETGCSLSHYLELYQKRRKALHQRRSKHPTEHPEPVATTWSLSFQKVEQANPAAAELLRFCAFLSPDAIPEALITEGAHHLSPLLQSLASDPMKLDDAMGELLAYSLISRNAETTTLSVHRLVQAVLLDEMNEVTQQQWAERVVRVVSELFPFGTAETWPLCRTYLPHALLCAAYVQQWDMASEEAADLLNNIASYLVDVAQYPEAEPLYQRALAIRERVLGAEHPTPPAVSITWPSSTGTRGSTSKPSRSSSAPWPSENTCWEPSTPTPRSLNNLALLYRNQGKYEQAEPLYQRALAIRERVLGAEHPDTARSLNNLALLYRNQGKDEQAEPLYQRALAIRERVLGAEHPDTARVSITWPSSTATRGRTSKPSRSTSAPWPSENACWEPSTPTLLPVSIVWPSSTPTRGRTSKPSRSSSAPWPSENACWEKSTPTPPAVSITWQSSTPTRGRTSKPSRSTSAPWPSENACWEPSTPIPNEFKKTIPISSKR